MASRSDPAPPTTSTLSDVAFVLCDLDGVVWLRRKAIPGAPEAIERLRTAGRRVVFVTNNAMSTIADQQAALAAIGVPAEGDVVTSAQAAASLVESGERVLACAGPGVIEAIGERGATATDAIGPHGGDPPDAVIVGLHQHFDYARMQSANHAIRSGARFLATNDDATYPTPDGPLPGAGSLVAAVATASATQPLIAGKPHRPMAHLVARRCGPEFAPGRAIMVGDRYSTDGRFAREIGCLFALVHTGVSSDEDAIDQPPDIDAPDLAAVVDRLLGTASVG